MNRQKFTERQIFLRSADLVRIACNALANAPIDSANPLEVIIREKPKIRKPTQSALMWAGPLRDFEVQAWLNGKQFSAEAWHEMFKRDFLPEQYDPELCKEGYIKWACTPKGDRCLVGSTTQLLVKGFSQYLEKVHAVGAELGVMFGVVER